MSRQLEQVNEDRNRRRYNKIVECVEFDLHRAITHAGGQLTGFAYKARPSDTLLIIKADFPAGSLVAFVGADDLGTALIKAVREGYGDKLRWREDSYRG